ncbi:MAG: aminopeptidase P family protein [Actinomycetota bacterium]
MNEEVDGSRKYDAVNPAPLAEFMKTGWAPTPLEGILPSPAIRFCKDRISKLSKHYPGKRIVLPAGSLKVRSNDTDYRFRAHSAFSYFTGVTGSDAVPDSVFILEPSGDGHEPLLFIHPRSSRDTDEFYRDAKYGEFWVGRRMTEDETTLKYGMAVRQIEDLKEFLLGQVPTLVLRSESLVVDSSVVEDKDGEAELLTYLSEIRLIKDSFEIAEMQKAVDATNRGFADMVRVFGAASSVKRGERIIEAAFFGRARLEGNDLGYDTIAASGSRACILHWIRNDGDVKEGDLILIDAGVEVDSLYTADITRTLPINGKFSPEQRKIYTLVYEAQRAGFAAVKPGARFKDITAAAHAVLAKGLEEMGVLPISAEESLKPEVGLHRRWTVHGVSHMLGIDVHDCNDARREQYADGVLEAGMILTVEPGLYIHPDDELFPEQYRGIGVRIEDDVLVTQTGCRVLSDKLPSHPDEVEVWISNLTRSVN